MQELRDRHPPRPLRVKFTGGPNGDVAGNAMRIMLERCPGMAQSGSSSTAPAALVDPAGADRDGARAQVVLKAGRSTPSTRSGSHPGGFMLFRSQRRTDGLRQLHRQGEPHRTPACARSGSPSTTSHQEFDTLPFTVPADLFIPAGGRPETIDGSNWEQFLLPRRPPVAARSSWRGPTPSSRPEARVQAAEDAAWCCCATPRPTSAASSPPPTRSSATCSSPSRSSWPHKERYVRDVLEILEQRAADEANLIMRRHARGRRAAGASPRSPTRSAWRSTSTRPGSSSFFQARPGALAQGRPTARRLLAHLPRLVRESRGLQARGSSSCRPSTARPSWRPSSATTMVYRAPLEPDFGAALQGYAEKMFG